MPGKSRHCLAQLLDQPVLVRFAPLVLRLQNEERVGLIQTHRVKAELIGPTRAITRSISGILAFQCALHQKIALNAGLEVDRGQLGDLHDHGAFVHRRHKGLADGAIGNDDEANARRSKHVDRQRKVRDMQSAAHGNHVSERASATARRAARTQHERRQAPE